MLSVETRRIYEILRNANNGSSFFSYSMLLVRHVIVLVQQTWAVDDALSKEFIII